MSDARHLDTRSRVELFRSVCEAVHEGHRLGIVHRDLKPGNLRVDENGRAKVIDFDLARVLETARVRGLEALELGSALVSRGHPYDHFNRIVLSAAYEGLGDLDGALATLAAGAGPAEVVYGRSSYEYFKLRRIGVEMLVRAGRQDDADAHARATMELLPPDTADPLPAQWREALTFAGARPDGN